jgi:hypothetical protein
MTGYDKPVTSRVPLWCFVAAGVLVLTAAACRSSTPTPSAPTQVAVAVSEPAVTPPAPAPTPTPTPPPVPAVPNPPVNMIAVGDIGMCGYREVAETAKLVSGMPGTIAMLGDIAYDNGTERNFRECFDPWWGPFKNRTRPVPGNHEYVRTNPTAAPYFAYFGANAGTPGVGYYSYAAGDWLVIALNSVVEIGEGSAQLAWLRNTLASSAPTRCTLAYSHHARYSSGRNDDSPWMQAAWRVLDAAGVDLVLAGHDHSYERFAPMDGDGRAQREGMRQFVVGTGGAYLYDFPRIKPNSEVRALVHGVLKLSLASDSYSWEFVPIAGKSFRDAGTGQCF